MNICGSAAHLEGEKGLEGRKHIQVIEKVFIRRTVVSPQMESGRLAQNVG